MIVLRRSTLKDLDAYINFAKHANLGLTSLPNNPDVLKQRLKDSEDGFKTGTFLFSLEKDGKVIGSSGIIARQGKRYPLFTYQIRSERIKSKLLSIERFIDVLHFHKVKDHPTEIISLFLDKEFREHGFGPLLSVSRFLFISTFRSHFAPLVMAELRGVSYDDGICPFWEAIGSHFFGIDFKKADYLRITKPRCIEHLFPTMPIYRDLLPYMAQKVIAQPHKNTLPAAKLLEHQGFKKTNMIDLFDAGPHYYAPTHKILAVANAKIAKVIEINNTIESENQTLIANRQQEFRAIHTHIIENEKHVILSNQSAELLNVKVGDEVVLL